MGDQRVAPGEIVVVAGPSGSGKSTLLKLLRGELAPTHGEAKVQGQRVGTRAERLLLDDQTVGWVPQGEDLQSMLRAEENVRFHIIGWDEEKRDNRVAHLLEMIGLAGRGKSKTSELSGGERQRLAIAKALAHNPALLLMDEVTNQMDLMTKSKIVMDVKRILKEENRAGIFVLHDPADIQLLADTLWMMDSGALVQHGTPNEVLSQPVNHRVAGVFERVNALKEAPDLPGDWRFDGEAYWIWARCLPDLSGTAAVLREQLVMPNQTVEHWEYRGHVIMRVYA